ncbi:MAG: SLC13 family permease [Candidatus Bipolaricaulota bacterium]
MSAEQGIVFGVLAGALALFVWGRWRYDLVALLALVAATVAGVVPAGEAFAGFAHPAVITVAAVLIISRGLAGSGIVDALAGLMSRVGERLTVQVLALTSLVAALSAFMNNVGALALLLPVGVRMARTAGRPPSTLLMPLAFGSLLGGLMTLIGTPPNIIVASFRAERAGIAFRMFDFTPVGAGIALAGVLFVALLGWRLVPKREGPASREELFEIRDYLTEVRLPEEGEVVGKSLRELEQGVEGGFSVVGLVRGDDRRPAPSPYERLTGGDVLMVVADSETLKELVDKLGLEMVGDVELGEEDLRSDEVSVTEAVVMPEGLMAGRSVAQLRLRRRFGVNLLAVARRGARLQQRLAEVRFRPGDVLLLQGREDLLQEALQRLGCLPLAERGLTLGQPRRMLLAGGLFASALGVAAAGLIPVPVAFLAAAVGMVLAGLIPLRELYDSVDWPVIVLLAAMIPIGYALESTGGAGLIADGLLRVGERLPAFVSLGLVFLGTMFLSDLVNNAAAAVLMAPIAVSVAGGLGVSADPFLMAVAVSASCAFLTPIGHQSNTLVMVPGGYRFGDYWRMGLPLELIIVAVGLPLIVWVWPL